MYCFFYRKEILKKITNFGLLLIEMNDLLLNNYYYYYYLEVLNDLLANLSVIVLNCFDLKIYNKFKFSY